MAFYLALAAGASTLLALGLLMMKSRATALPAARGAGTFRAILKWICDPVWIGGLTVQTLGYALYVVALSGSAVSLLAVMMQGGIAIFVLFSVLFLGERARAREWLGIGSIVLGMVLLTISLP
ncbi:MAG TPA: hypothetical protein VIX12_09835, partial [Candidatus Binataceae bacterium]